MFEISRHSRRRNHFSLTLLLILILPVAARAQVSTTGKITGVVTDPSGATVATATVTVKSPSLMADRSERAQADGSYLFDLLPPGTYEVTVTANGFQTLRQTGIVITAGFTATVNNRLRVGTSALSPLKDWRKCAGDRGRYLVVDRCPSQHRTATPCQFHR